MGQIRAQWRIRSLFRLLNKLFMVPAFRLGAGPLMGNPLSGYIMVIKTIGRKTGRVRYTPVNYALLDGNVYCVSGFGQHSDWSWNLRAAPLVELILPGGTIAGVAEEVEERAESLRALRQVLKNAGLVGLAYGIHPTKAPDEILLAKTQGTHVVRIRPVGVGSGPSDAGGWLWITLLAITAVVIWLLVR